MNLDRPGTILCFGEMLLRLSAPAGTRLKTASTLDAHVGGAEANVAAMLAQLGHSVSMATVLPRSGLGDLCEAELRRAGVRTEDIIREDGRMGLYFVAPWLGSGIQVIYDRENSTFAEHTDAFNWAELAQRTRWFHLSGINLALGDGPAKAALTAVQAMKAANVPVSFDVNHRASLWQGRSAEEYDRVRQVAEQADLLFASPRDVAHILDDQRLTEDHRSAAEAAFGAFANTQLIASTRRQFDSDRQLLSARLDDRNTGYETRPAPLRAIVERIGSGDAFAGTIIDGVLAGASMDDCVARGLAGAVSKHAIVGDRWIGTREDLQGFDPFAAPSVDR